jgi:hypothetical protein
MEALEGLRPSANYVQWEKEGKIKIYNARRR